MKSSRQLRAFPFLLVSFAMLTLAACTHQKPEASPAQLRKIASAEAELQNEELESVDEEEAAQLNPGELEEIRDSRGPNSKIRKDFEALFGQYPEEKIKACSIATDNILKLNFFSEGRGMMISPGLISMYRDVPRFAKKSLITRNFGLNFIDGRAQGLFWEKYKKNTIGVLGCVACHSGQAAGYYVVGLGNKNIDVQAIGSFTHDIEDVWKGIRFEKEKRDPVYRALTDDSIDFAKTLSNPSYTNLTQGLVPTGIIRTWFYRQAGKPIPEDLPRAAVKVPFLWGYGEKKRAGQFADGGGNGALPGWAIAVELVANQRPETIRKYFPKIQAAEDIFSALLPPRYPFEIKVERAARGKTQFENTCAHCHGTYERTADGVPVFKEPTWIRLEIVKTDSDRLNALEGEFLDLVANNPLKDILQSKYRGRGYFAPRLEGVWARFPYLHNGSVPSIRHLLSPPADRPKTFSVRAAGSRERFDPDNLGLTMPKKIKFDLLGGKRSIYDTSLVGQSNAGHEFYTDLSDYEKTDIIEYLKTL